MSEAIPALAPADLEIRVTTRDDGHVLALDYVLHSPNGRFELSYVSFPGGRLHRPDAWQKKIFKTLEKLHLGLDSHGAPLTHEDVATELAALGEDLSHELFPSELQQTLQRVRQAETVLLVSDEPWIPWELVKPYDSGAPGEEDEGGFLADRFQFTRWLAGGRTPAACIDVARLAVVEAGSPPDLQPLTKADDELRFLRGLAARHGVEEENVIDATHARVLAHLRQHDLGLVHFIGHGEHDAEDPGVSGFHLHDGRTLRPRDLRRDLWPRLRANRPLVFLNSCQAGRQGWSLTRPGGWAQRFVLDAGCGAFVAPQWTVGDDVAHTFATVFYEALERGETFGQAVLAARRAFPKDSPGRLAYAVYAHPNGRLDLNPAATRAKASSRVSQAAPPARPPRPSGSQRLTALLAWYLPDSKGFSRVCRSLDLPVWPLLLGWTPSDRWHEVVTFCARRDRLTELRRVACADFPAAAARPLRDPRFDIQIPHLGSARREIAQRLRGALPGSLTVGPRKSRWTAEEFLGHRSLRRIAAAESSSAPAHGAWDGLLDLVQSSELDAELEEPFHSDWILKCREHLGPDLDLPLAALALVSLCEESPKSGKAAMHRTMEHLDRISGLQLDLTAWWLRWWPAGAVVAESWLRKAVERDPPSNEPHRTMARLSRLERLLLGAGAAPWSRIEDAPSLSWAVRAGLFSQLAALLENLGEERQSVYLKFFSETGSAGRVLLARSLRRLAQIQGGFESLPPEPWATALRCSLSAATSDELQGLVRDDERLKRWLPVLPQTLTDPQLDVLIEVFQHRPGPSQAQLAKDAGARLAAHPDPPAVWSRLRSAGRPWIRIWAQERAPDEPLEPWLDQLAISAGADPEMEILRQTWHDAHPMSDPK